MGFDILSYAIGLQAGKGNGGEDITLVENMQIPVDFSNGNQYIEAPEGTAVKSAVIQKPENLKAENIAEGIDIAGIIGTLVAGGGDTGGNVTYTTGRFEATEGYMTVEHGGTEVPDFLLVYIMGQPSNMDLFFSYGFSERMIAKMGGGSPNKLLILNNGSSASLDSSMGIETAGSGLWSSYGGIYKATATTFGIGGGTTMGDLKVGGSYGYIAVFGLA